MYWQLLHSEEELLLNGTSPHKETDYLNHSPPFILISKLPQTIMCSGGSWFESRQEQQLFLPGFLQVICAVLLRYDVLSPLRLRQFPATLFPLYYSLIIPFVKCEVKMEVNMNIVIL